MVFHWSLSDSKFLQVSRTFLRILSDFNNAVVPIILILPPIFNSSSLLSKPLRIVPSPPVIIGIIVILMQPFYSEVIVYLFAFFDFHWVVCWDGKVHNTISPLSFKFFLLFFLTNTVYLYHLSEETPCIVFNVLVFWSIWLSSSLVHLKNGHEFLTSGTYPFDKISYEWDLSIW